MRAGCADDGVVLSAAGVLDNAQIYLVQVLNQGMNNDLI